MKGHLLYALPSEAHRGDSDRNISHASVDFEAAEINDGLSDSMYFYYEKAIDSDDLSLGRRLLPRRLLVGMGGNCV